MDRPLSFTFPLFPLSPFFFSLLREEPHSFQLLDASHARRENEFVALGKGRDAALGGSRRRRQ
jgi:hypothetical protein